jgi:UAA transporter family
MLFITVQLLPTFLSFPTPFGLPRLRPRQIPLSEWGSQVVLLTFGALLNNWAYAYRVPLTVQIVFRSAGNFPVYVLHIVHADYNLSPRVTCINDIWLYIPQETLFHSTSGKSSS